tara:strand:+ start:468 stop:1370 length:903 start_codon:yes stop_codon:yes gene_type:complete
MRGFRHKNHYHVLGIHPGSGPEVIKRAYRKLARENHPDFNPTSRACEERLKEINGAYEALMDPILRERLDSWLERARWENSRGFSIGIAEEEKPFCYETLLDQERVKAVRLAKWAGLFFLPPVFYVLSGRYETLHEVLDIFVILFVGTFYAAMVMAGKATFHASTVWVMRSPKEGRVRAQVLIVLFAFTLPLIYFSGGTKNWSASVQGFISHTWVWLMFAVVIIALTSALGAFYRSPMIFYFPFRIFLLGVYLTFILAFCKAIPMVDKGEALFDYIFFNAAIQTGLFLSLRANRKIWKIP